MNQKYSMAKHTHAKFNVTNSFWINEIRHTFLHKHGLFSDFIDLHRNTKYSKIDGGGFFLSLFFVPFWHSGGRRTEKKLLDRSTTNRMTENYAGHKFGICGPIAVILFKWFSLSYLHNSIKCISKKIEIFCFYANFLHLFKTNGHLARRRRGYELSKLSMNWFVTVNRCPIRLFSRHWCRIKSSLICVNDFAFPLFCLGACVCFCHRRTVI